MEGQIMNNVLNINGLVALTEQEAAMILGGVDKRAQDALYTIGYIIGVVVRFLGSIFAFTKKTA